MEMFVLFNNSEKGSPFFSLLFPSPNPLLRESSSFIREENPQNIF